MAFNNFPYADMQDLNIDWLLRKMKETDKRSLEALATANSAKETAETLTNFVNNYFDNLDVQEEINNKINEMADSGELAELLKAIKYDYVTPQMFGAKGDGVTDDSDALNALFASVDDKYIFIPSGTYFCASDITLELTDNNIVGAGEYEAIIKLADGVSFTINKERNTFSNLKFQGGLGVICNTYHNTFLSCWFQKSQTGIQLNNGYICQFTNCYITNNKLGVLLNNQSYETVFNTCVIDNNAVGVVVAGDSAGCVFDNCTIEGNYNRASGVGCGVFICSANTRAIISKCHFESNGNSGNSVDILSHNSRATAWATDMTDVYNEVAAVFSGSQYAIVGIVSVENCRFYATKYGIVVGGSDAKFVINNNYFSGVLNRGNKPVLINGSSLLSNKVVLNDNVVKNTNNSAITTEMLDGVKSSYVYTDIVPTSAQQKALIDGQIILDDIPLFLYKGRLLSLEGDFAFTNLTCADGTSKNGGIVNGNVTNYFPDATKTIYVSTPSSTYNVFAQSGYNEFIVLTNNKASRVNTSSGFKAFSRIKHNVFPINRFTLSTREMYSQNDAIVYGFIQLSVNDIKKMQGCIGFEPTDLSMYEFRN